MLDTGAQPNLLKIGAIKSNVRINAKIRVLLTGITEEAVETLGTAKIRVSGIPVSFHVIPDNFPIVQQGILGSAFFTEHNAQIDYRAKIITWEGLEIAFKGQESLKIPARTNAGFVVRVANPEIKTGYLPRLYSTEGVYVGDSLVTCVNGKGYIRAINTTDKDVELLIPTVRLREISEISIAPANKSSANPESSYSGADAACVEEQPPADTGETTVLRDSKSAKSIKFTELSETSKIIDRSNQINCGNSKKNLKPDNAYARKHLESPGLDKTTTITSSYEFASDDLAESLKILFAQRGDYTRTLMSSHEPNTAPVCNKSPEVTRESLQADDPIPIFTISKPNDSSPRIRSESPNRQTRDLNTRKEHTSKFQTLQGLDSPNEFHSSRVGTIIDLLRLDHLNELERENIRGLVSKHSDRFYILGEYLDKTSVTTHQVTTTDNAPVHVRQYRFPQIHKDEITKQVSELVEKQIVKPSNSPYNSPVWIVPKKPDSHGNKRWRMVIDYRKLNDKTIGDAYPLPNICDILDQLGGAKYFSVLDLASGFHQIPMHPEDACKTAFSTPHGHFQFERMPFGLKNAPATFQRLMDQVLTGLQGTELFVYMDDIVVYACSLQEHDNKIKTLMSRLREANLQLQPDKCEFLRREVAYLGHIIGEDGIRPNPEKLSSIREFPTPRNQKNIRQFLGLAGYYRRFIPSFSSIAKPLTKLLKDKVPFDWTVDQQKSFDVLKNALCNEPVLQYPDFSRPFILTTDASKFAIGGVLSQGPIGQDLPIAYASRVLDPAELNYSTIEKELLAINYCVHHFRPYLYGRQFTLVTDHRPLTWLYRVKDPTSRLMRWRLKLEEYDYVIVYKSGLSNTNADALSRNPPGFNDPGIIAKTIETTAIHPIHKRRRVVIRSESPSSSSTDLESESETDEPCVKPRKISNKSRTPTEIIDNDAPISTRLRNKYPEIDKSPSSMDDVPLAERLSRISRPPLPLPKASLPTNNPDAWEDISHDEDSLTRPYANDPPPPTNSATFDPLPAIPTPRDNDSTSSVPLYYADDGDSSPPSEVAGPPKSELSSEHESDSNQESENFPAGPATSLLIKESRDDLLAPRDNIVIMTTVDAYPFDAGARLLVKRDKLPPLENLTLGRGQVVNFEDSHKHLIVLAVKERRSTLLDSDILTEAFQSLLDIVRELNIKSFSIAKSEVLDDFKWLTVRTKLESIFAEERVKITICPGFTVEPPECDRSRIIAEYHSSGFGGHKGVTKTYRRIRQEYNWPNLKQQIRDFIAQCRTCQLKKLVRLKTRQPMILTDTPGAAFDKIALDIVGPLPRSRHDKVYLLTMQDLLTKYSVAVPLAHITAEATAAAFVNNFICRFGCPRAILTDQGTNFTSRVMREIANQFAIEQIVTTAFHPQSNGSLERSHHVLYEYIKCFIGEERSWDTIIERAMFAYNTSVHEGTQFTPHELVFGRAARMPSSFSNSPPLDTYPSYLTDLFDKIYNLQRTAAANLERSKRRSKAYYDRRVNEQNYKVGDHIFLLTHTSSKLANQYTGPHEILEILPDGNLRIRVRNRSKVVHPNRCRISRITDPGG